MQMTFIDIVRWSVRVSANWICGKRVYNVYFNKKREENCRCFRHPTISIGMCFFLFHDLLIIVNQFRSIYLEYLVVDWIFLVHVSYKLAQWKWDSASFMCTFCSFATQWPKTRQNRRDRREKPRALPFHFQINRFRRYFILLRTWDS